MAENELNKATIANWALSELGLAAKFSIDDDTPLGGVFDIMWPRCVAQCFSLHDWTFLRHTFHLTRQAARPDNGWPYGFDLPGGRFGEPVKNLTDPRRETPLRDFRIEGDTLFADVADVWSTCKVYREPVHWDWQFANCFATAFASYLAVPLLQDAEMAEAKYVLAFGMRSEGGTGGMFGRLIAQNRAAHPLASPSFGNDPLTGAHGGSYPWHGRW